MAMYSGFTHWKWWFSIEKLVYQRVKVEIWKGNLFFEMLCCLITWSDDHNLVDGAISSLWKWWSSSMGTMTSHIWWNIKNIWIHQPVMFECVWKCSISICWMEWLWSIVRFEGTELLNQDPSPCSHPATMKAWGKFDVYDMSLGYTPNKPGNM